MPPPAAIIELPEISHSIPVNPIFLPPPHSNHHRHTTDCPNKTKPHIAQWATHGEQYAPSESTISSHFFFENIKNTAGSSSFFSKKPSSARSCEPIALPLPLPRQAPLPCLASFSFLIRLAASYPVRMNFGWVESNTCDSSSLSRWKTEAIQ